MCCCTSESDKKKKALVQWFVCVSEVPPNKMKLLGREPHPQEIFYYEGPTCDDEIDVESILNTVQVRKRSLVHLNRASAGAPCANVFLLLLLRR